MESTSQAHDTEQKEVGKHAIRLEKITMQAAGTKTHNRETKQVMKKTEKTIRTKSS